MNSNIDVSKLLEALSKMDKKDLEAGIAKANQVLQNTNKEEKSVVVNLKQDHIIYIMRRTVYKSF